ncbi:MAG: hypothetical protein KDK37_09770 [Leptospiraceae bacterium]|nr:hypothetical protein [Leptospiraceae bacterium]
MAGFFQRVFAKVRRKKRPEPAPTSAELNQSIEEIVKSIASKLDRFLITRKVAQGPIQKSAKWALHKNHTGLFRLDAEGMSILLFTEPFLVRRQDKIQGLLPISEVDLCRAAQQKDPSAFLLQAQPPSGDGFALYESMLEKSDRDSVELPSMEELRHWNGSDIHRLLSHLRMNVVAHALIHASAEIRSILLSNASRRYREMMILELEALRSPGSDPDLNPNSQNLGLLQFDRALKEFQSEMRTYLRQKRPHSESRRRAKRAILEG